MGIPGSKPIALRIILTFLRESVDLFRGLGGTWMEEIGAA